MSNRYSSLKVVFENPVHEDGIIRYKEAIEMIAGVQSVHAEETDHHAEWIGETRVKNKISQKLSELAQEVMK